MRDTISVGYFGGRASKLDPHFQCVTVVKFFEQDTKVPQCDLPKDALPLSFSLHIVNLEWQKH